MVFINESGLHYGPGIGRSQKAARVSHAVDGQDRLGLHELLEGTDPMKSLIKRKSEIELIRRQAIADGMTTLKQDGILKCFQGLTDIKEVRKVCIK